MPPTPPALRSSSMLLLSLLLLGCAGKDDPAPADTGDPDPLATQACTVSEGDALAMVAGATPDTTAPAIQVHGQPADVTLVSGQASYVRLQVDGAGPVTLWADTPGIVHGLLFGTGELTLPTPEQNPVCPDALPEGYALTFDEAGTYFVRLAWTGERKVWLWAQSAETPPADPAGGGQ